MLGMKNLISRKKLTWLGGICFPLRRSSKRVPKLYVTLSGVTLPAGPGDSRHISTIHYVVRTLNIQNNHNLILITLENSFFLYFWFLGE